MNEIAWQVEYSVDADAAPEFAWRYWTDVRSWDDPPARFELDGPFAAGSRGATLLPGQEPVRWRIRDVQPGESYVLETPLDRATFTSEWRFEPISDRKTRLTQRLALSGENWAAYAGQFAASFGSNLAAGMERVAATIARAEARSTV